MEKTSKGILYVLIAMVLFSTGGLLLSSSMPMPILSSLVGHVSPGLFLPLIQWRKLRLSKNYFILAMGYCYLCIMFVLTTKITTAANAIILQCTAPLWLYLFYLIRGKNNRSGTGTAIIYSGWHHCHFQCFSGRQFVG